MIRPGILQNFLLQVALDLKVHYPEYELVLDKVENYYSLPLINFKYDNDTLTIQIPLLVKDYIQQALYPYNLRTMPLPYHINARLLKKTRNHPHNNKKKKKNTEKVVETLDKIIEETSTDNMDCTTINQMQYTAALLITNKITPPKPATNRKPRGRPLAWQQRLQKQIRPTKRRHIHHH